MDLNKIIEVTCCHICWKAYRECILYLTYSMARKVKWRTVKSAKQTPPSPLPFFCQLRPKQFCFGSRSLSNFSEWCFLGKLSIQAFYSDIIFTTPWTSFELKIVVTFLKVFTNIRTFSCFKDNEKKSKSQKSSFRKKLEKNKQKALKIVMQEDKPNRTIIFFPSKVVKTTRGRWEEECNKKIYEFRVPNISKKICFLPQNFCSILLPIPLYLPVRRLKVKSKRLKI